MNSKPILLASLALLLLAGCETLTVKTAPVKEPFVDLGPAAPFPDAPSLTPQAVGGLVCFVPDEAVQLGDLVVRQWPTWGRNLTAKYEFMRDQARGRSTPPK